MGYYTSFKLDIIEGDDAVRACNHEIPLNAKFCPECGLTTELVSVEEIISSWCADNLNEESGYQISDLFFYVVDEWRWYDHKKDMIKLSKAFPNIVFMLTGEGERNEDLWHEYYKNGKVQVDKAQITYDGYDESKLE